MFISLKDNNKNKTITYLSKPFEQKLTIRFSGTKALVTAKKIITPQMAIEQANVLRNKFIFLKYCEHFKKINYEDLKKDDLFIKEMDDMINSSNSLNSRAFQLALEVTYRKRHFNIKSLQTFYENDFRIENIFNANQNTCEQSTIHSALLAKNLVKTLGLDKNDVIVNCTPYDISLSNLTKDTQKMMTYSKEMTGNSCCDLRIKDRPFDFKDTKDICIAQNHVYNLYTESIFIKGYTILLNLEKHLDYTLKKGYMFLDSKTLKFIKQVQNQLQHHREMNTPLESRFDMLNKISITPGIPKEFKMPIFLLGKKPLMEQLFGEYPLRVENVPLPHGSLDYPKAQKAIMGICSIFDKQIQNKITEITQNSLTFHMEELD